MQPDVVAFSKKVQLGGVMAGGRVDEVADNVFAVSGRINSTWGGGLVDMVRSRRILEIIETEGLIEAAAAKGARFLAGLQAIAAAHPEQVANARGRGLFLALDLADREPARPGRRRSARSRARDRAALRRAVAPVPSRPVGHQR